MASSRISTLLNVKYRYILISENNRNVNCVKLVYSYWKDAEIQALCACFFKLSFRVFCCIWTRRMPGFLLSAYYHWPNLCGNGMSCGVRCSMIRAGRKRAFPP